MYAAPYMGMNLFTAGMVLSIFALSNPLGTQTLEVKQALGRIIRMTSLLDHRTPLLAQSSKMLQELLGLILNKEMEAILGQDEAGDCPSSDEPFAILNEELPLILQHQQTTSAPLEQLYPTEGLNTQHHEHHNLDVHCSLGDSVGAEAVSFNPQQECLPGWNDVNLDVGVRSVQQGKFQLPLYCT